ncbi:MAG: hypothetical protein HZA95_03740 [Candidatus Vogelbacteria bacterium]|nr:hypothetical protein [Candidatus Vogelbacteria bacterium]
MLSFIPKRIVTGLIFVSFVAIVFFGFASMTHAVEGAASEGCPLVGIGGTTLCPQNATVDVTHHISAYEEFLSIPRRASTLVTLIFTILTACAFFIYLRSNYGSVFPVPKRHLHKFKPVVSSQSRQVSRWLSLLENSPSLI